MTKLREPKCSGEAVSESGMTRRRPAWLRMVSPSPLFRPIDFGLVGVGLVALLALSLMMNAEFARWLLVPLGWFLYCVGVVKAIARGERDRERSPGRASDSRGHQCSGEAVSEAGKTRLRSAWLRMMSSDPLGPLFKGIYVVLACVGLVASYAVELMNAESAWWVLLHVGCWLYLGLYSVLVAGMLARGEREGERSPGRASDSRGHRAS